MNALMKEAVRNLHLGRHTQQEGLQRGDFPVDHGDARFALALSPASRAATPGCTPRDDLARRCSPSAARLRDPAHRGRGQAGTR